MVTNVTPISLGVGFDIGAVSEGQEVVSVGTALLEERMAYFRSNNIRRWMGPPQQMLQNAY